MAVDKKLPAVPETILKRRKRQAAARAERAKATVVAKKARHAKRIDIFKRAEKYVKNYREKERDEIRLRRDARKNNG
jgi:large subunit ribosomal protein L7e